MTSSIERIKEEFHEKQKEIVQAIGVIHRFMHSTGIADLTVEQHNPSNPSKIDVIEIRLKKNAKSIYDEKDSDKR